VKGIKAAEKYVAGQLKKDLRGIAKELKMDSRLPTYGISGETKSGSDRKKRFALRSPFINLLIAYEPVWAIGTGKNDSPADARAMAVFIKKEVDRLLPLSTTRDPLRVLYGGSVHGKNAHDYLSLKEISGALVGGASLKADEFRKIVNSLKNSLTS
jgi:triosephosphate isomerase